MNKFRFLFFACCLLPIAYCLTGCMKWSHDPFSSPPESPQRIDNETSDSIKICVASFNVSSGTYATPSIIAKIFMPYNYDVICFIEVPSGDWIERVSKILGMNYYYLGNISSANEKDKYKAILSRTPIHNPNEFVLNSKGWFPASVIKVEIYKNENKFIIVNVQIPNSDGYKDSYAWLVADGIAKKYSGERLILTGDFDNTPTDAALKVFHEVGMDNMWDNLNINISKEYTCCLFEAGSWKLEFGKSNIKNPTSNIQHPSSNKHGITDHILYSSSGRTRTLKGGYIDLKYDNIIISNHKPVWALLEFSPPVLEKEINLIEE